MSPTHWLIILGVLVLLFEAKRLPDAAGSLGRSARILTAEVKATSESNDAAEPAAGCARTVGSTVAEATVSPSARAREPAPASAPTVAPD